MSYEAGVTTTSVIIKVEDAKSIACVATPTVVGSTGAVTQVSITPKGETPIWISDPAGNKTAAFGRALGPNITAVRLVVTDGTWTFETAHDY